MMNDNNYIQQNGQLSRSVVSGGIWITLSKILQHSLNFIRTITLARLLSPDNFGLFGIAMLALTAIDKFSFTGFDQALIQKRENIEPYLDSAWTIQVIRGLILGLLLFCTAPLVAKFFHEPQVTLLLKVLGFSIFIGGFRNIGIVFFHKNIQFNRMFIYELSGTITDFGVALTAAIILRNAWALVFGFTARNIVQTIVSYVIHQYKPRFKINWKHTKDLLSFGQWIWGSTILIFLLTQGDDILVGKILGTTALGFYQMGYKISNLPATEITHALSQVIFPAYSRLQDNIPKLRAAFLRVFQMMTFITFPIAILIFVLAPDFTIVFLGEKWMPMVPVMKTLCYFAVIRTINSVFSAVLTALGKPRISTIGSFFQLILFVIIVYPLIINFGLVGVAYATIIPNAFFLIYIGIRLLKEIDTQFSKLLSVILPSIAGCLSTYLSVTFVNNTFSFNASVISIISLAILGGGVYIVVVYLSDILTKGSLTNSVKQILLYKRADLL